MTQGLEPVTRANIGADGIPESPSWMSDMEAAGLLTVLRFDKDYELAMEPVDDGAHVLVVSQQKAADSAIFYLGVLSLDQIAAMAKKMTTPAAISDAKPLRAVADFPASTIAAKDIGDFQTFQFVTMDEGKAALFARAVDKRFGIRLIFESREAVARFAVSLTAARDVAKAPVLEKLDVPYTTISAKNPIETPEQLSQAVRMAKTASGKSAGLSRVSSGLASFVPVEILEKFDDDGMPIKREEKQIVPTPQRDMAMVPWMIVAMLVTGILAFMAARLLH